MVKKCVKVVNYVANDVVYMAAMLLLVKCCDKKMVKSP